jgi:hypothetical protein
MITLDDIFAGTISSFIVEGDTKVTYWIDRSAVATGRGHGVRFTCC